MIQVKFHVLAWLITAGPALIQPVPAVPPSDMAAVDRQIRKTPPPAQTWTAHTAAPEPSAPGGPVCSAGPATASAKSPGRVARLTPRSEYRQGLAPTWSYHRPAIAERLHQFDLQPAFPRGAAPRTPPSPRIRVKISTCPVSVTPGYAWRQIYKHLRKVQRGPRIASQYARPDLVQNHRSPTILCRHSCREQTPWGTCATLELGEGWWPWTRRSPRRSGSMCCKPGRHLFLYETRSPQAWLRKRARRLVPSP